MKNITVISLLTVLFAAGCAQQSPTVEVAAKDQSRPATIKPGAAVRFSHQQQFPVMAGESGAALVTVEEDYEGGTLWLQASGDDGLTVLNGASPDRYSMNLQSTHEWTVAFEAETDGVYYVNVLATVEPDGQPKSSRAYAARVVVGGGAEASTKKKNGDLTAMPSGGEAVILEAEEDIKE